MKLRDDKYANRYRKANPDALLAHDVTVAELIAFLSKLPPAMIVNSWDSYSDDRSNEITVEPDPDNNRVTITG